MCILRILLFCIFREFETAAQRSGIKLGRAYKNFNNSSHSRGCIEPGVKLGVNRCSVLSTYTPHTQPSRLIQCMGMAHLIRQLGLPANPELPVPTKSFSAATLASQDVPQSINVYRLLGEFAHTNASPLHLHPPLNPQAPRAPCLLQLFPAQHKVNYAVRVCTAPIPVRLAPQPAVL